MALDFTAIALDLLAVYGLLAVFILLTLDGAMLLPGLPGEIVVVIYVTQYVTTTTELVWVVLIGVAASIIGAIPLYFIGRAAAANSAKKRKRLLGMSPEAQERMQRVFKKPAGGVLLVFARLFLPTRVLVSVPAGLAKMPFKRFLVLSILGTLVFYVAFLWITFELRRPGSKVADTAAQLENAYASPVYDYMAANWIIAIVALVALGLFLSIKASRRMSQHAHETSGSLIGTLVQIGLLWGGALTLIGLWLNDHVVYDTLGRLGLDVDGMALGVPGEPVSVVAFFAGMAILVGLMMRSIRRTARRSNKRLRLEEKKLAFQGRAPDQPPPMTKGRRAQPATEAPGPAGAAAPNATPTPASDAPRNP